MSLIEYIARTEGNLRPTMNKLPSSLVCNLYSNGRKLFLSNLVKDTNFIKKEISEKLTTKAWGLEFQSPLFNAAGMFKTGDGYQLAYLQGAGAFLAGTTTSNPRAGNKKNGILHPFMSYPNSGVASNWMGLPNEGHHAIAKKISQIEKWKGCPIGVSIAGDSDMPENKVLDGITEGLELYSKAGADFIEINESCPNVSGHKTISCNFLDSGLTARLFFISERFIKKQNKPIPLIVKFSNDTSPEMIPALIDLLLDLGFSGVNFGNTSTMYERYKSAINSLDLSNYDYFTKTFGGGLSGAILKENSLELGRRAVDYIAKKNASHEFHVIRTGGITNLKDLLASKQSGITLNQWFTGYFEAFSLRGHSLYSNIYRHLS